MNITGRFRCRRTCLVPLMLTCCPLASVSAPLVVVNPGFEDITGESPFNEFTFGPLNGWDLYDPDVVTDGGDGPTFYIGTLTPTEPDPIGNPGEFVFFPDGAAEGQRMAIAFNFAGSGGLGEYGLRQVLGDTLQPFTRYTLEVEIGNIASGTAQNGDDFDLEGFPGYRVDLMAGDLVVAQDNNSLAGTIPEGEFATSTVTLITGASHTQFDEDLQIRLVNLNQVDPVYPLADLEVDFDDVRLDASPAGDFDGDGDVDNADILLWQRGGSPAPGSAADLLAWSFTFGQVPPSAASIRVPEPAAAWGVLALTWTAVFGCCRQDFGQ